MRGSSGGASPAALAAWQQRTFPALRPKPTPFLDELPDDLLADVEATRRAIDRARRTAELTAVQDLLGALTDDMHTDIARRLDDRES